MCVTRERIRHQSECSWNPAPTNRGVAVAGVSGPGNEAGECRSYSGVTGRNAGGVNSAVPVFYPDRGVTLPETLRKPRACSPSEPSAPTLQPPRHLVEGQLLNPSTNFGQHVREIWRVRK